MSSDQPTRSRVLLLGLGPTAGAALEALSERFDVVAMVRHSDPDDPTCRRAAALGVPVSSSTSLLDVEELVLQSRPDCVVVSSYDRILPASLLELCPFVNVHYAPLPRYRGRANVNWLLINGCGEAAVTVHCMASDVDAGGILAQQGLPLGPSDSVTDVYERLNTIQRAILADAVERRLAGSTGETQDEWLASYCCSRITDDGEIDWSASTASIDRLVRALAPPFPGAFTFADLRLLWIDEAKPVENPRTYVGRVPGRIVGWSHAEGWVDVLTGDGVLRVTRVRREGEPPMAAADALHSSRLTLGARAAQLIRRMAAIELRLDRMALAVGADGDGTDVTTQKVGT